MCLVLALAPAGRANDYDTVGFMIQGYPSSETTRHTMINMFRTLYAANDFLENRGAVPIACQPFGSGTDESYAALMAYLQTHPDLAKRPTSDLWDVYVEAMAMSFPCKN
ncbi:hypothetical protein HFO63_28405 [Rhizobium laguerreae]|uniref:hypothetical protein n=1 Tax=Rhizobium laguerreae TaxID=1076926 RepID=UPI001C910259|nr:hypothetical protein [Rhizobium laguerreae]MBY3088305.1 hypothetical protein [Rhizobium laguerreae]MBY3149449.1 hypothetical protein [Rhizobium laguerreae]